MVRTMIVAFSFLLICSNAQQQNLKANRQDNSASVQSNRSDLITEFRRAGRLVVNRCKKRLSTDIGVEGSGVMNIDHAHDNDSMLKCMQMTTLRAMDRLLALDVIELPFGGLRLIKDVDRLAGTSYNNDEDKHRLLASIYTRYFEHRRNSTPHDVNMFDEMLTRTGKLLRTHSLQIPLPMNVSFENFEARRRHRQKNDMMGIFLFGIMAMAVIAIPLGFQFLAVLGGKALMLAKLALILTSIQGLKKIATSNLSYGLYQAPPHSSHSRPWLYDRRWQHGQTPTEHHNLFDNFDVHPETPAFDEIGPRIMLPRRALINTMEMEHPR